MEEIKKLDRFEIQEYINADTKEVIEEVLMKTFYEQRNGKWYKLYDFEVKGEKK